MNEELFYFHWNEDVIQRESHLNTRDYEMMRWMEKIETEMAVIVTRIREVINIFYYTNCIKHIT